MAKPTGSPTLNSGNALGALCTHAWLCYEGTGTTVHDLGGSPNNGTFAGGAAWGTNSAGDAVVLGATDGDQVNLASPITLGASAAHFSIAWRAYQNPAGSTMPFGDHTGTNNFVWYQNGTGLTVRSSGSDSTNPNVTLFTSQTDNYVLVYDGSVLTLYKNGAAVSGSIGFTTSFTLSSLLQGYSSASFSLKGGFDYLYIFDGTALNSTQVSSLNSSPYQMFSASASFTVSPSSIPKGHAGNITLTLTGTSTSWTSGTTFTLPSITGLTLVSKTFNSSTSVTLVVTTGTGTGTGNITDSTDAATAALTVGAPSFTLSPSSGTVGGSGTVTATGTNTVWSQETAATLFSLTGGTGASLSSISVASNTSATFSLVYGSATATLTITDTPTGDTASFTVGSVSGTIAVTKPTAFQAHQRSGTTGSIPIAGTYTGGPADLTVEASFNGGAYGAVGVGSAGTFSGTLPSQTQGQGTLTVRFRAAPTISTTVASVLVTDVFLIAGQSNASGRLTIAQTYAGTGKPGVFTRGQAAWQDGSSDPTSTDQPANSGSLWPLFATLYAADQGFPPGFLTLAVGSTGLYSPDDWPRFDPQTGAAGGTWTGMTANLANSNYTGCKAVLWYQGEQDVASGTVTRAEYASALCNLADSFAAVVTGAPKTIPFQIGYTGATVDNIRLGISDACKTSGNILGMPAFYDQSNATHPTSGGNPDSPLGLLEAKRFWAVVKSELLGGTSGAGHGPRAVAAQYDGTRTSVTVSFDQVLKTGLTFDATLWAVTGNGTPATISAIAYASDPNSVTLTLSGAASLPILVNYGLGSSTAGKVAVLGPDFAMPAGLASPFSTTINLPAEPFSGLQAAAASGSGGAGGGGGYYGG